MKNTTFRALLSAGIFFSLIFSAEAYLEKTHRRAADPTVVLKLREKMFHMESQFLDLQESTDASRVDFDTIALKLEKLKISVEDIRKVNTDKGLAEPLQKLSSKVSKLHRYVKRQDPISLRKGVDGLYQSCFQCHSTHAPLM